uniref:Uncharacterized protein n=1 Tax=Romanomermis culicivorax TaxID=13658 RepID=A0A915JJW4_ROMCU
MKEKKEEKQQKKKKIEEKLAMRGKKKEKQQKMKKLEKKLTIKLCLFLFSDDLLNYLLFLLSVLLNLSRPKKIFEENPDRNCVAVQPKIRRESRHPSTTNAVWQTTLSPALDVGEHILPLPLSSTGKRKLEIFRIFDDGDDEKKKL